MNPLLAWTNTSLHALRAEAQGAGQALHLACAQRLGTSATQALVWLAERCAMPLIDEAGLADCTPAFDRLPLRLAQRHGCLLTRSGAHFHTAVLSDPLNHDTLTLLHGASRDEPRFRLADPALIAACLARHEERERSSPVLVAADDPADAGGPARSAQALSRDGIDSADSAAERLVNATVLDALKAGASDVHLEAQPEGLVSRFRIDGALETIARFAGRALAEQAISRIKVLAELDIGERRVPQDGSFRVQALGREIDLRVSIMPSVHGEDAVIRVLDKNAVLGGSAGLRLQALSFAPATLARLRRLAALPYGLLLVTGPTGSGKTTTLYAALTESQTDSEKIVTIEDPVEYQLPGVLQIPVNAKKGLTFATGLRSILRHDPDKIMVGEIRDRETAEIAIQSALTGHLVLSTLHANTVFDVFGRIQHMGVDLYAFVNALGGVSAQRLLRLVCPHCAEAASPDPGLLDTLALTPAQVQGWRLQRGRGCTHCRGSGLRGRRAVAEVLAMSPAIAEAVVERRPMRQIIELARAAGVASLHHEALALARAGLAPLEEVARAAVA